MASVVYISISERCEARWGLVADAMIAVCGLAPREDAVFFT